MTNSSNDLSPEDVRKAQALAPQLDPDMARAIAEGNGPVIQAIANGAATDTQIAERLISMGLTTGLPPGVQQMVNEKMQLVADKREAESRNSEKQTAGMAGLALPGDSGEARAETSGSGRAWTQNIAEMDFAQKMSYLNDIEDMSFEKFAAKSDAERRKDLENIKKDAEARLSTAQGELTQHHEKMKSDPRLGATPEERQRAMERIDAATDIDRFSGEQSEAEISKLPSELQAFAREEWRIKRSIYYNQNAITQADRANEALNRGDLHGAWKLTTDAAAEKTADMRKNLGQNIKDEQKISNELKRGGLTEERRTELLTREDQIREDNRRLEADLAAAAKVKYDRDDMQKSNALIKQGEEVAKKTDASIRKTQAELKVKAGEIKTAAKDENEFDIPTAPVVAVAATAERLTVGLTVLVNSGQLAPPLPEAPQLAANDLPTADTNELPQHQQKIALAKPKNDSAVG